MGLFNFFGENTLKKVIKELKNNNLEPQAMLLEGGSYTLFSEDRKKTECDMLKKIYDLKQPAANESLNRFKWARDICEEHSYNKGVKFMQNYVDIYNIYLNDYCDN
ncbi:hypothetical protein OAR04_01830 [Flavobacteriales bacterium]|nr:hypothetical protein [Flavobacteriales bacterium]